MTLLEAVNNVLIRLRENEVTDIDDTAYSRLITRLVNDSRREVEDAWNWLALRSTNTITTAEDVSNYSLTGVGNARFKVMSVINDTTDNMLHVEPSNSLTRKFLDNNAQTAEPLMYGFNSFDTDGDPTVDLYPIPDGNYILRFNLVVPQNDLETGNSQILVPGHIVTLGAYVKALAERGEEGNSAYNVANAIYLGALASAVSQEEALLPGETDFYAV